MERSPTPSHPAAPGEAPPVPGDVGVDEPVADVAEEPAAEREGAWRAFLLAVAIMLLLCVVLTLAASG